MAEESVDRRTTSEAGIEKPDDARELAIQRLKMKQDFKGIVAGGLFAIVVCIVIWALGDGGYFWPVWVCLGVAIAIITQGWKAYGPSNRITEADVQREMEKG
ncbi:MAG TPA: 2TM domain-containing protein [Solirubrobacterales bacterium]|nr:2TM domain-containing protein [Solirubrobacterales bacterium]